MDCLRDVKVTSFFHPIWKVWKTRNISGKAGAKFPLMNNQGQAYRGYGHSAYFLPLPKEGRDFY